MIMIDTPATWSTSSPDVIHVVPSIATAGGRPFASLGYRVLNPINGLMSPVMEVQLNIRCAAGHYLNAAAKECRVCPVGTYRQSPSYEPTCCDLAAAPGGRSGDCFQCEKDGMIMVPNWNSSLAGTVTCMWAPCGEYETELIWDNGGHACIPSHDLPPPVRVAMTAVSGLVLLIVVLVLGGVVYYRETRVMVSASFRFLLLMLLGLLLMMGAVILELQPATPGRCFSKTILFHVGFSLMFSSATGRAWRLHRIFNAKRFTRVKVTDGELAKMVAGFVWTDLSLILVWWAVAPFEVTDELQKECESELADVFFGLLLVVKVGLMAFGCWAAYQVRSVPSIFNERSGIALTLNNVAVMALVVLVVTNAMRSQLKEGGAMKLLQAIGGLVGVITPLSFIFLPKLKLARVNATCSPWNEQDASGTAEQPPQSVENRRKAAAAAAVVSVGPPDRRSTTEEEGPSSNSSSSASVGVGVGVKNDVEGGARPPSSDVEEMSALKASMTANDQALAELRSESARIQGEILRLSTVIQNEQDQMEYLDRRLLKAGGHGRSAAMSPPPNSDFTLSHVVPISL